MVTRGRGIGSLVVALLIVGGCAALSSPEPTLHDDADMPSWASIVVTADPRVAERDVDLAIVMLPEAQRLRSTTIPAGTVIRWDEGLSEGPYRVVGPEAACSIDLDLPPERATEVVLTLTADDCFFRVAGPEESRPPAGSSGTIMADVTVKPWDGLLVEVVSLDEPRQPVPPPVPPDEGGLAIIDPLYPGRYDVVLRRGDQVLETQRVTILDRGDPGPLVSLEFDGLPD
jgi:hypothetical protein